MKCLSIKQPWASLICCGAKDVENRSWRQKEIPGRILVHAGAKRMFKDFNDTSIHEQVLIEGAIEAGVMPPLNETPVAAIIGYADVVGFVETSDSPWAQDGQGAEWKWQLANARLFKEPIPYKGKLGLFDVPEIDENNLPETWDFPALRRKGQKLIAPVSSANFESIRRGELFDGEDYYPYSFDLTDANLHLFTDDELCPLETTEIEFVDSRTGERLIKQVAAAEIEPQIYDDTQEPIIYENYKGEQLEWIRVTYALTT